MALVARISARVLLPANPGETRSLPNLPGYRGPILAACGPDGGIETAQGSAASWILPVAPRDERILLWEAALGQPDLAKQLASEHRHGTGRIAHLARLAHHHASLAGHSQPSATMSSPRPGRAKAAG